MPIQQHTNLCVEDFYPENPKVGGRAYRFSRGEVNGTYYFNVYMKVAYEYREHFDATPSIQFCPWVLINISDIPAKAPATSSTAGIIEYLEEHWRKYLIRSLVEVPYVEHLLKLLADVCYVTITAEQVISHYLAQIPTDPESTVKDDIRFQLDRLVRLRSASSVPVQEEENLCNDKPIDHNTCTHEDLNWAQSFDWGKNAKLTRYGVIYGLEASTVEPNGDTTVELCRVNTPQELKDFARNH